MKCGSFYLAICSFFFVAQIVICTQEKSTKNTIFLWDIHDVLIERDMKQVIKNIWNYDQKIALCVRLNRQLIYEIYRALKGDGSTEEIILSATIYNNSYLYDFIPFVCNAQIPIVGTWNIIKKLHEQGFKHYVGSNIGKKTFAQLIDPKKNPEIASLFNYFDLKHPQVVEIPIIKKPSPLFFQKFLTKNNINLENTTVVFIDDNKENVKSAQHCGLIGIVFTNPNMLENSIEKYLS